MSKKTYSFGPSVFELLEKREREFFFEQYSKSPTLFNWSDPPRSIPPDIMCKACLGTGDRLPMNGETCSKCLGKGVPPIPNSEIFEPKKRSKGKK